jgi:hypothetical protein
MAVPLLPFAREQGDERMAQTIAIPGRRVSQGETFYTDWTGRGGDCVILRVEVLIAAKVGSESVSFALETRGEDGGSTPTMVATYPVGGLELTGAGVATCHYVATTSTSDNKGALEQVRVKVSVTDGSDGGYFVVRIFPLIFFDNAK